MNRHTPLASSRKATFPARSGPIVGLLILTLFAGYVLAYSAVGVEPIGKVASFLQGSPVPDAMQLREETPTSTPKALTPKAKRRVTPSTNANPPVSATPALTPNAVAIVAPSALPLPSASSQPDSEASADETFDAEFNRIFEDMNRQWKSEATPAPTASPMSAPQATPAALTQYDTGPTTQTYSYVIHGQSGSLDFTTYAGLSKYQAGLSRSISYRVGSPTPEPADFVMRNLDEPHQQPHLDALAAKIQALDPDADDQARIAISLVQHIPYDWDAARAGTITGKFPYETLHTDAGVCQEKSELMVLLLKKLGFAAAVFRFESQNHETVGVKCAPQFDYLDSGYCFIETTGPAIPTYSSGNYANIGQLTTMPVIVPVGEGRSMDLSEEYADAQDYEYLIKIGPVLSQENYAKWLALGQEYGLKYAG